MAQQQLCLRAQHVEGVAVDLRGRRAARLSQQAAGLGCRAGRGQGRAGRRWCRPRWHRAAGAAWPGLAGRPHQQVQHAAVEEHGRDQAPQLASGDGGVDLGAQQRQHVAADDLAGEADGVEQQQRIRDAARWVPPVLQRRRAPAGAAAVGRGEGRVAEVGRAWPGQWVGDAARAPRAASPLGPSPLARRPHRRGSCEAARARDAPDADLLQPHVHHRRPGQPTQAPQRVLQPGVVRSVRPIRRTESGVPGRHHCDHEMFPNTIPRESRDQGDATRRWTAYRRSRRGRRAGHQP
jgi:hypothetical protein